MPACPAPLDRENLKARDCMTSPALAVALDDTARHAAELMIRHRISGLPVIDETSRPVGLVSEADFVFGAAEARKHRQEQWLRLISDGQAVNANYLDLLDKELGRVRRFMASPVIGVEADAPLNEVVRLMAEHGVRRVIVTREGKLAGVVTRRDLLRVFSPETVEALPDAQDAAAAPLPPPPPAAPRRAAPSPRRRCARSSARMTICASAPPTKPRASAPRRWPR
jgi:CBS domain-containing protein